MEIQTLYHDLHLQLLPNETISMIVILKLEALFSHVTEERPQSGIESWTESMKDRSE